MCTVCCQQDSCAAMLAESMCQLRCEGACGRAAAQIIALGACYFFAVTALDVTTNVGTIDDLTSIARIILVRAPSPAFSCAGRPSAH